MLQEGEDGSDQVREQQVPPASVEEQLWELWLGGGVDALEATISKFDEKFAAATLHYGGTSLRIVGLATRMRISKTIRTADIDGTSENNRALGRGRLQKVRLLMYFWTTDIAGTSENNRALVDISGRAYLVEAHDSGVGNFVRLSAGYRLEPNVEFLVCPSRERLRLAAGVPRRMDKFQLLNIRDALFSDPLIFNRASFLRTKASAGESSELPARLVVEGGMDEMDDTVDDGDWTEGMMDEMYGDPLDACDRQQRQSSIPRSTGVTAILDDTHCSRGPRSNRASICNNPFLDIVAIHGGVVLTRDAIADL
ncbi:hypothetical protein B0H14DRAFT_2641269 [Mycena olivaceomarginata]|nr:hypothetical protein B0H14DRAFT_2641269 [Mycena olivaceomarginata]